jgi:hypothetical protein
MTFTKISLVNESTESGGTTFVILSVKKTLKAIKVKVFANACNQEGALDRLFLLRQVGKMKKVHDVPKYNHAKRYLFSKQQY